ncbi:MAG: cobalamin B12-binding domain-containing protein, partial [bacterium]
MNVLLINPTWQKKRDNIWRGVGSCYPPIGLLSIAGTLEQEGHEVKIFDANADNIAVENIKEALSNAFPDFKPDITGITIATVTSRFGYETADACKALWPLTRTVLGGVHATCVPKESIEYCDIIVRG